MFLSTEAAGNGSALFTTVFAIFGGFWTVVLIVLFLGVGALLKRYGHDSKGHHH